MHAQLGDDRGFVLIVVLSICLLMALIAAVMARAVQSFVRETSGTAQSAQAEFLAEAGVKIVGLELASQRDTGRVPRFRIDGTEWACRTGDAELQIKVQDTGGKVNVNLADDRLLSALFIGLSATPVAATTYADRILDFRDADGDKRVNGAERDDYLAAGRALGPKNALFESREELFQVLGLDAAMIRTMWPYITLHSETAGLDPETTSADLAAIVTRGQLELPHAEASQLAASRVPAEFVVPSPRHAFDVVSAARLDNGAVFVRDAGLDIPSSKGALPRLNLWARSPEPSERQWPPVQSLPPC